MLFFARLSTTVALLAVVAMVLFSVSGCASQANRDALAAMQDGCNMGDAQACLNANTQAEANRQEAAGNAVLIPLEVAAVAVLLPLYVLMGADDDDEVDAWGHHHHVHHAAAHWHR
jgi:hypothetical protein